MVPSPRQLARAFTQHEAVRHMRPNAAAVLPRSPCRTNRKDPTPQCPSKRPVRHACPRACPRGFSKGPVRRAYPRGVSERTCPKRQNHGPAAQRPLSRRRSAASLRSVAQRPLNIPAAAQYPSRRSISQPPLNIPAAAGPPSDRSTVQPQPSRAASTTAALSSSPERTCWSPSCQTRHPQQDR